MYNIKFEKRELNYLNKLDKLIKERIWNKLQDTKEDPFRYFEKLVETEGFKLRVGDYRIIADIDRANETINILKIGHRKNIYDEK